jgi:hypothetical protein
VSFKKSTLWLNVLLVHLHTTSSLFNIVYKGHDSWDTTEITGTVTNLSGITLEGIAAVLMKDGTPQRSTKTDLNGQYSLTDIAPGRYSIIFSSMEYDQKTYAAQVNSSESTRVDAVLNALPVIAGNITDNFGSPVAGANIEINGVTTFTRTSDIDGNYRSVLPGAGIYNIKIHAAGYNLISGVLSGHSSIFQ